MMMTLHIAGGALALIGGGIALFARKGDTLHRGSGVLFSAAMLLLATSAIPLAVSAEKPTSLMGGVLVIYLVVTSLMTIRRSHRRLDWAYIVSMLAALSIAIAFAWLGFSGLNSADGTIYGLSPLPMFVFGATAFLAALGDLRVLVAREIRRPCRIARHLWRMCFALLLAAVSFFLGQADVIPDPIRYTPLLAIPPLAVIILLIYWMVRVRWGGGLRRSLDAGTGEV